MRGVISATTQNDGWTSPQIKLVIQKYLGQPDRECPLLWELPAFYFGLCFLGADRIPDAGQCRAQLSDTQTTCHIRSENMTRYQSCTSQTCQRLDSCLACPLEWPSTWTFPLDINSTVAKRQWTPHYYILQKAFGLNSYPTQCYSILDSDWSGVVG